MGQRLKTVASQSGVAVWVNGGRPLQCLGNIAQPIGKEGAVKRNIAEFHCPPRLLTVF